MLIHIKIYQSVAPHDMKEGRGPHTDFNCNQRKEKKVHGEILRQKNNNNNKIISIIVSITARSFECS